MIRLSAEEFWPRYRDEVRRRGSSESLAKPKLWTKVAIEAAKAVCMNAGLKTNNELHLDTMGYEQRQAGVDFNWDLRVAFEHENTNSWRDELCKLCHVVADLRVLVGYFTVREQLDKRLQERIDLMDGRMSRVTNSQWLFIFGPSESERDPAPWVAYTLDDRLRLVKLPDNDPFNPYMEYSRRSTIELADNPRRR